MTASVVLVDTSNNAVSMATAAKQPALGTAGSASADVITVQGVASGTALFVDQTKQSSLVSIPGNYTFQRPADATAYAVGDLVANSTTAGSVVPMSWTGASISAPGSGEIAGVTIVMSAVPSVDTTLRVHFLMTTAPTFTNGDNGAAIMSNFAIDKYIGSIDVVVPAASTLNGSGPVGFGGNTAIPYKLTSGDTIYGVLETRTAFTPGNAMFIAVVPRLRRFS